MNITTFTRTVSNILFSKCIFFAVAKKIVTFYYNIGISHPNIFKKNEKMSIDSIELKKNLELLKASSSINIDYIY